MFRMLVVDLLLLLGHGGGSGSPQDPPAAGAAQPTHIFILAGQSNMAGRGGVSDGHWDGQVPPECSPSPRILRLNAALQWEVAREPLHADVDVNKTNGIGPGMVFATEFLAAAGHGGEKASAAVVGLVPCATGGTNISQWGRGGELYRSMVMRAEAAAGAGGGRLSGMLWYQGKSDTVAASDAESYGKKMRKLMRELRWDLKLHNLPVMQVALASSEGPYMEKVRQGQLGLGLSNVVTVDAKGLPLLPDNLHLTTQAQVQLGKMLATAYLNHFSF